MKVCKRPLVNEVLGLLLTEFFPDPTHKGTTSIQRGFYSFFGRIWALSLTRHCTLPDISKPPHSVCRSVSAPGSIYLIGAAWLAARAVAAGGFRYGQGRRPLCQSFVVFDHLSEPCGSARRRSIRQTRRRMSGFTDAETRPYCADPSQGL
jgi:hypothetical protein